MHGAKLVHHAPVLPGVWKRRGTLSTSSVQRHFASPAAVRGGLSGAAPLGLCNLALPCTQKVQKMRAPKMRPRQAERAGLLGACASQCVQSTEPLLSLVPCCWVHPDEFGLYSPTLLSVSCRLYMGEEQEESPGQTRVPLRSSTCCLPL